MKKILTFFCFMLMVAFSNAQDKKLIDSLETLVKTSDNDSIKLVAYGDLCWNYGFSDFNKALYYGKEELDNQEK